MNMSRNRLWKFSASIIVIVCTLWLSSSSVFAHTPDQGGRVFAPQSRPYGLTYAQWSARWWIHAFSLTNAQFSDPNDCSLNQQGPLLFLRGTTGGPAIRSCTIPGGKAIMFPIFNAEESILEAVSAPCLVPVFPAGTTDVALRTCAIAQASYTTALSADLDGKPIQDLRRFFFVSPPFNFSAVNGNAFGVTAGPNRSVSAGNWVILKPLHPGFHTLNFSGTATFPQVAPYPFVFTTTVTYNLFVISNSH